MASAPEKEAALLAELLRALERGGQLASELAELQGDKEAEALFEALGVELYNAATELRQASSATAGVEHD